MEGTNRQPGAGPTKTFAELLAGLGMGQPMTLTRKQLFTYDQYGNVFLEPIPGLVVPFAILNIPAGFEDITADDELSVKRANPAGDWTARALTAGLELGADPVAALLVMKDHEQRQAKTIERYKQQLEMLGEQFKELQHFYSQLQEKFNKYELGPVGSDIIVVLSAVAAHMAKEYPELLDEAKRVGWEASKQPSFRPEPGGNGDNPAWATPGPAASSQRPSDVGPVDSEPHGEKNQPMGQLPQQPFQPGDTVRFKPHSKAALGHPKGNLIVIECHFGLWGKSWKVEAQGPGQKPQQYWADDLELDPGNPIAENEAAFPSGSTADPTVVPGDPVEDSEPLDRYGSRQYHPSGAPISDKVPSELDPTEQKANPGR